MTCTSDTNERLPRRPARLRFRPLKGEVYWCDYPPPESLHLPEFWKRRPVVIISRNATLRGVATVMPMTSSGQQDRRFAVPVGSLIDGRGAWAICNHAATVAVSRLLPVRGRPSVSLPEYEEILQKVIDNLQ